MLDPNSYADQAAGQQAVDWLLANSATNARRLGVMYLIWNRRIWSAHRDSNGWRPYNYGDPHVSHIHVSFDWAGAEKRTSWWTGKVAPMEYGPCRKYIGDPVPPYGDTVNLKPCPKPIRKPKHKHTGSAGGGQKPATTTPTPAPNAASTVDPAAPADPQEPQEPQGDQQATPQDQPGPADEVESDPDSSMDPRTATMPKHEPMPPVREPDSMRIAREEARRGGRPSR
jgi:hypothetical protein